jgi:hypothetical protein
MVQPAPMTFRRTAAATPTVVGSGSDLLHGRRAAWPNSQADPSKTPS